MIRRSFLAAFLLLAACENSSTINTTEVNPKHDKKMSFAIPAVLDDKSVDLNDKEAVANVLGIKLTGDKKQHLYDIVMTSPSTDEGIVTRKIPILVENLAQGSGIIYGLHGEHMSKKMPEPASKKSKKKITKK